MRAPTQCGGGRGHCTGKGFKTFYSIGAQICLHIRIAILQKSACRFFFMDSHFLNRFGRNKHSKLKSKIKLVPPRTRYETCARAHYWISNEAASMGWKVKSWGRGKCQFFLHLPQFFLHLKEHSISSGNFVWKFKTDNVV